MEAKELEGLIEKHGSDRSALIAILQDLQRQQGYLAKKTMVLLSERFKVPLSRLYALATFYRSFTLKPTGRHKIGVCLGTACHIRGGQRLVDKMERDFSLRPGETTEDQRFTLETANCLGCCALGPVVVIDGKYESKVNPDKLDKILKNYK